MPQADIASYFSVRIILIGSTCPHPIIRYILLAGLDVGLAAILDLRSSYSYSSNGWDSLIDKKVYMSSHLLSIIYPLSC